MQQVAPALQRLEVRSEVHSSGRGGSSIRWYIDCFAIDSDRGAGIPAGKTVRLLTEMSVDRSLALSDTLGCVYALADSNEPVVIQTTNGVVVGEVKGLRG